MNQRRRLNVSLRVWCVALVRCVLLLILRYLLPILLVTLVVATRWREVLVILHVPTAGYSVRGLWYEIVRLWLLVVMGLCLLLLRAKEAECPV